MLVFTYIYTQATEEVVDGFVRSLYGNSEGIAPSYATNKYIQDLDLKCHISQFNGWYKIAVSCWMINEPLIKKISVFGPVYQYSGNNFLNLYELTHYEEGKIHRRISIDYQDDKKTAYGKKLQVEIEGLDLSMEDILKRMGIEPYNEMESRMIRKVDHPADQFVNALRLNL